MEIPKPLYLLQEIKLNSSQLRDNYLTYIIRDLKFAVSGNAKKTIIKGKSFYGQTVSFGLMDGTLPEIPKPKGAFYDNIKRNYLLAAAQANIRCGIEYGLLFERILNLKELEPILHLFKEEIIVYRNSVGLIFEDGINWFLFREIDTEEFLDIKYDYYHIDKRAFELFQQLEELLTEDFVIQAKNNVLWFERLKDFYSGAFSMVLENGTYEKYAGHLYWVHPEVDYPYKDTILIKKLSKPIKRRLKVEEAELFRVDNFIMIDKVGNAEKKFIKEARLKYIGKTVSRYHIYAKTE